MSEENPNNENLDPNSPPQDPSSDLDMNSESGTIPMEEVKDSDPYAGMTDVEILTAQLADAEKRVVMEHADTENYRKRARRDMQDQVRYASLRLMSELLESVDNLERAIESYETDPNGDGLCEGVKLVSMQISKVLTDHGCKKIEALGQPFDPNLHQALQMQPSDEHPANTVMLDLRAGFQLHDRLIRPAQVFVSTGASNEKK